MSKTSQGNINRRSDGLGYWGGLGDHDPPTRKGPLEPVNERMRIRAELSERRKQEARKKNRLANKIIKEGQDLMAAVGPLPQEELGRWLQDLRKKFPNAELSELHDMILDGSAPLPYGMTANNGNGSVGHAALGGNIIPKNP